MDKKRGILVFGFIILILNMGFGDANIFSDKSSGDFNGTYSNTNYDVSGIVLSSNNLTGNYVSRVFDGSGIVQWNSLNFEKHLNYSDNQFSVDYQADVWKSVNYGVNWSAVTTDYGGGIPDGIAVNSSKDLFILGNQDLWQSTDNGVNWIKVNDDVNGAGDSNSGLVIAIDSNDYIYIIDGSEDVLKSTNSGVNFTKINNTDFNNGNGNVIALTINSSNSLFAVDSQSDVWKSDNSGVSWTLVKDDYNDGAANGANDMAMNDSSLFIIDNQDLWQSTDNGVNWIRVNDDVNGAGDTNQGIAIFIDKNNFIYLIDASEDVFKSTNSGVNFTKIASNFNNGNANVYGVVGFRFYSNISFQVKNCSFSDCSDGNFVSINNSINLTGRYFQYKAVFNSEDSGISPRLYNVSIDYSILDNVSPLVNIVSPVSGNYLSSLIDFKVYLNEDGSSCLYSLNNFATNYTMAKINNTYFSDSRTISDGSYVSRFYCLDNYGNVNNSETRSFSIDTTAPVADIISPQNQNTYGYNESIALDFSASDSNGISNCWYNLDNGNNISISNCLNTSFSVSGNGVYSLNLYANDSFGWVSMDNVNFSVNLGAPTITINSPISVYLKNRSVEFKYISSDIDLQSCELWGDFDGDFKLNQTNNNPFNGTENIFNLDLNDGTYLWNVRCNDSQGHSAFNGNKSFVVDSTKPVLSISEPTGTKASRTGIAFVFSVSDINLDKCWYNVYRGVNLEIQNTTINCSSSMHFNVTIDADFAITLYANDSAGNLNSVNSNFKVETSSPIVVTTPSSGGGGGGSVSGNLSGLKGNIQLSATEDIIARAGDKKILSLNVINTGKIFLNKCRLIASGEISSWIYSNQITGIAPGENKNFIFDLNVPDGIEAKDYSGEIKIACDETSKMQSFKVILPTSSEKIKIKEVRQEEKKFNIIYSVNGKEFNGENLIVYVWVLDSEGIEVKRIEDRFLFEGESMERNLFFDIPEDLIGIFSVYAALSSDSNNFARQSVILGDSGATGFAIFDEPRNKLIAYLAFVIIIVLAVLLIVFGWRRKEKKYHESHSLYSNHHIHHPSLHHIKKLPNYGHH